MKKIAILICLIIMTTITSPFPAYSKCRGSKILFAGKVLDFKTRRPIQNAEIIVFLDGYYAMALNPIKDKPIKYTTDENGHYVVPAYDWPKEILDIFCIRLNRIAKIIALKNEYFPRLVSHKLRKLKKETVKDKNWGEIEKYKIPDVVLVTAEKER